MNVILGNSFTVYNDLSVRVTRKMDRELLLVENLGVTNIFGIVFKDSENKFGIWDDHTEKLIGELTFKEPVLSVRLRKDLIVITTKNFTYLYDLNLKCKGTYSSSGPAEMNDSYVIIPLENELQIIDSHFNLSKIKGANTRIRCAGIGKTMVACTSERGTIIRVFKLENGESKEFRRSIEPAVVNCLTFNETETFLAVSSEKGTIHIFSLQSEPGFLNYLTEERSVISFNIKEPKKVSFRSEKGDILSVIIYSEGLLSIVNLSKKNCRVLTTSCIQLGI